MGACTWRQVCALLDSGPFHYPQRLYMATLLGAWMQILISAVFGTIFSVVGFSLRHSIQLSQQLGVEAQYTADMSAHARYGSNFQLMLTSLYDLGGLRTIENLRWTCMVLGLSLIHI